MRKYAWLPDLPDIRDFPAEAPTVTHVPASIDLEPEWPEIVDQGQLGSCTGNSSTSVYEFVLNQEGLPAPQMSRLFSYYNGRLIEGTTKQDAGAQIRDVIKGIAKYGLCPETEWPYITKKFATKPLNKCYADALQHRAVKYSRLDNSNLLALKTTLAAKRPFVFGFTVYESFESDEVAKSGIVPMPGASEKSLGGHAVGAAGYNDSTQMVKVANSWGKDWGQHGFFWMPYAYITNTNLADDFWKVEVCE